MRLLSTFLVFIALSVSFGQLDYEQSVINELCSDKYSGRGYVNQGDSLAAEYIKKQFQEIKLALGQATDIHVGHRDRAARHDADRPLRREAVQRLAIDHRAAVEFQCEFVPTQLALEPVPVAPLQNQVALL